MGILVPAVSSYLTKEAIEQITQAVKKANEAEPIHKLNPNILLGLMIVCVVGVIIITTLIILKGWFGRRTGL